MEVLGGSGVGIMDLNDALISNGIPPRDPVAGALWIDTSTGTSVLKVYQNNAWVIQKLDVSKLDPDLATKLQGVIDTLGTIANDGILTFSDRVTLAKELGEILGTLPSKSTGNVYPSALPDYTVLDSSGSGTFANMRLRAIDVGIGTDTAWYKDVETAYKALNSFLSTFTPKPWDITTANKDINVTIATPDVFRQRFLDYYMAELRLATETEKQAKIKAEEYAEKLTDGSSVIDKAVVSGNPAFTDKSDDAVVHVGVDGKSEQKVAEGNPNMLLDSNFIEGFSKWSVGGTGSATLDPNNTYLGFNSAKLVFTAVDSNGSSNRMFQYNGGVSSGGVQMAYGAYVKADKAVRVGVRIANSVDWFNITTEWAYISGAGAGDKFLIFPEAVSTIWVNQPKTELGSTATPIPTPSPDYPSAINNLDKSLDIVSSVGKENLTRDGRTGGGTAVYTGWDYYFNRYEKVKAGDTFTSSIWVEPKTFPVKTMLEFGEIGKGYSRQAVGDTVSVGEKGYATVTATAVTDGWVRQSIRNTASQSTENTVVYKEAKMEKGDSSSIWNPSPYDSDYNTQSPTLYKTNILLSEPLRSVGNVHDRVYLDSLDSLWKVERNIGEYTFTGNEAVSTESKFDSISMVQTYVRDPSTMNKSTDRYGTAGVSNRFREIANLATSTTDTNVGIMIHSGYTVTRFKFSPQQLLGIAYSETGSVIASGLQNWLKLNATTIVYRLETPTIETLSAEQQNYLNNIASFKGSNYVYTMASVTPNLNATFKAKAWYRNYVIERDIAEVESTLGGLKDFTDGAFTDGLISRAEAKAIAEHLNTLAKEKLDVDANVTIVYGNAKLIGTPKTNLNSAKTAWNTAHTSLLNAIIVAIADGKTTVAEKADVDSKFTAYGNAFKLLTQRLQEATIASGKTQSEESASNAVNAVEIGVTNLVTRHNESKDRYLTGSEVYPTPSTGTANSTMKDLIPVKPGENYMFTKTGSTGDYWRVSYLNASNVYISRFVDTSNLFMITVPTGVAFMWVSYPTSSNVKVEKGNKASTWSPSVEDQEQAVKDLRTYTDGSFKDGVISSSEAKALGTHLNTLAQGKKDLDANYNAIYGNVKLLGTPKTNLLSAKTAWNTAYTNLVNAVTTASTGGTVTPAQVTAVNTMFTNYGNALQLLTQRTQEAVTAINKLVSDESAKDAVDGMEIGGVNMLPNSNQPITISPSTNTYNYIPFLADMELNQTYTFSANIEKLAGTFTNVSLYAYPGGINISTPIPANGRVSLTFTKTSTATNSVLVYAGVSGGTSGNSIRITKYQLEKGTKATAYGQAPEDIQEDINKKTGAPVRYIRDWLNGSDVNTSNHWVSLQAIALDGTDRARGVLPTSDLALTNPTYLTNGSIVSTTYVSGASGGGIQYVQVDLGKVYYDIADIRIWHYYVDSRTYYNTKTEISADGINWEPLYDSLTQGTYPETAEGNILPTTVVDRLRIITSRVALAEQVITPEAITGTVMSQDTFVEWKGSVDSKANGEDVNNLMLEMGNVQDTLNGTDATEGIITKMSTVEQLADSWTADISELKEVTGIQGTVTEKVTAYMEFKMTGLEIGKSDSDMKVNISNSQIDFMDKGVSVAYINGQKMFITQVEITESLIIGNHKIEKLEGNADITIVSWVGQGG